MSREKDTKLITLGQASMGDVKIADEVVAVIAGYAATEVEGIAAMAGNITSSIMNRVGVNTLSQGVKINIDDRQVAVDLSVIVDYGYSIPITSRKVQDKVKASIENMTGLEVTDVNVRIAGVQMEKNNKEAE